MYPKKSVPGERQPFVTIERACEVTGLSQSYLRRGVKDGSVPHVKSGRVYLVNIPALLRDLGAEEVRE